MAVGRSSSCAEMQLTLAVFSLLCKLAGGGLLLTLEEPGAASSSLTSTVVQVNNISSKLVRRIDLVTERTFHLHCQEEGSHQPTTAVWFTGDKEVPESSAEDPSRPMVFSYLDGSRRMLVLSNFSVGNVGLYRCRERGSANTDGAGIVLGAGNPTVVTGAQNKVLRFGQQDMNSRPSLVAFVSGTPYPAHSNIEWRLNNGPLPDDVVAINNELLLPSYIGADLEGRYTCHVTTSAGTASDDIYVMLIYTPAVSSGPSGTQRIRVNSSITIYCEDSDGVPPPVFTWLHNGSNLTSGDHLTRVDTQSATFYRSSLTIANLQPTDSGDYQCTASNDAGFSQQTITLVVQQQSPPAPPTNIHVAYISSCSIRVEWVWPQSPPTNDVALPDYAVFEVNMIGESDWTEIGRADVTHTTLMTRIPAHGLNTAFQMRAKCVSIATGDGSYFTVADTYLLYSQDTLPSVALLPGEVLSSSAIQLSWNIPEQSCYNFTSFSVLCSTASINATPRSISVAGSPATMTGLAPATSYNCSVTTNLIESLTGAFSVQVRTYLHPPTTTYPSFASFRLNLKEVSNCETWIDTGAAEKKSDIVMAIAEAIEELCSCGFTASYVKTSQLQCSPSSSATVVYDAELHETLNSSLPTLMSLLRRWAEERPSFVVQSQLVQVDVSCFTTGEGAQCETEHEQSGNGLSTYTIVGVSVGLGVAFLVIVSMVTVAIVVLVSRHQERAKSSYTSSTDKSLEVVASCQASNPTAINGGDDEGGYPYYEQMDVAVEPQYESLDDYDRLARHSVGKTHPKVVCADCPAYESIENRDNFITV